MDFSLTDEQQLLLDSVDELMERYGTEQYFKECDEKHVWPQEFTDALLENGFQMLGVDEKFGGTPVDVTTLMLVSERICKNGAPIYVYGNLCALKDMTEYGTPEQQEQCFAEVMAGKVSCWASPSRARAPTARRWPARTSAATARCT